VKIIFDFCEYLVKIQNKGDYMKEKEQVISKRNTDLQKMISDAQHMPGIADMMKVYGKYDEFVSKSQEYLKIYTSKTFSSLSNNSS
jgi:hypothetical protein